MLHGRLVPAPLPFANPANADYSASPSIRIGRVQRLINALAALINGLSKQIDSDLLAICVSCMTSHRGWHRPTVYQSKVEFNPA
jgi:hypothetical protein